MELYQIRYFLAICEHGSFSRAADACDVSQPALTAAIKKLEVEIGSPLLHREGKRLVLTELGCRVRPHLEQALGETRRVEDVARNFRLLRQAPLRVGAMPTIGPAQLSRFFASFRESHPGIDLTVHQAPLAKLLHDLEAGELDLAVASSPQPYSDIFRSEPLYKEKYVVAFPAGHPFERLSTVALQDTSGKDYVDRLACELREIVMGVCKQRQVEIYAAFRSDREDWVQSMVLAGLGFAFMPEHSVTLNGLLTRALVDPVVERAVDVVEVRGRKRSPVASHFFDAMHAFQGWSVTRQRGEAAKERSPAA
jgi:DNA-binding transcriptional LysR family regulator